MMCNSYLAMVQTGLEREQLWFKKVIAIDVHSYHPLKCHFVIVIILLLLFFRQTLYTVLSSQ
jgi:hypothetical protein